MAIGQRRKVKNFHFGAKRTFPWSVLMDTIQRFTKYLKKVIWKKDVWKGFFFLTLILYTLLDIGYMVIYTYSYIFLYTILVIFRYGIVTFL